MTLLPSTQAHSALASDLDWGRSLPPSWYTDPTVLALEYERIFRRTWQYVARAEQLAHAGDYVTGWVGNLPIVVACSEYGLNGFVNVAVTVAT
jgi:choline monooxygenase